MKCAFLPQAPSKEGFRSLPSHPPPLRPPRATPPSRRAPLLPGAPPPPAQFRFAEAPSSDSRIIEFLKISCTGQLLRPEAARAGIPGPQGRGSCPLMLRPLALLAPGREANGRANLPGPALRFHTKRKLVDLCKSRLLCEALYTRHRIVRRGRRVWLRLAPRLPLCLSLLWAWTSREHPVCRAQLREEQCEAQTASAGVGTASRARPGAHVSPGRSS